MTSDNQPFVSTFLSFLRGIGVFFVDHIPVFFNVLRFRMSGAYYAICSIWLSFEPFLE